MPKKVEIQAYHGFGNNDSIYSYGRIIESPGLSLIEKSSLLRNFRKYLKRLGSNELSHQVFQARVGDFEKECQSNSEGFFRLHEKHYSFETIASTLEIGYSIDAMHLPQEFDRNDVRASGKIFFPHPEADYGVISDVDDTILTTDVLSKFKLKMMFNTLFLAPHERQLVPNTNEWFRLLHQGKNPFFYISNSPWNLYDSIMDFIQLNKFPIGPVLLRDFGRQPHDYLQRYEHHKMDEIQNILDFYPDMKFILIGDGGEHDTKYYLDIRDRNPDRILDIFIRKIGDSAKHQQILKVAEGRPHNFHYLAEAVEAMEICREKKYC